MADMKKARFVISSLLAAGVTSLPPAHAKVDDGLFGLDSPDDEAAVVKFAQDHRFTLAQHRSHSSHASHSSHRSGTSGRVRAPTYVPSPPRQPSAVPAVPFRNERSTPPSSILPSSPAIAPQTPLQTPSTSQIRNVVMRVQLGLKSYGYYDGVIDGVVGAGTRDALRRFQTDYKFSVTGTVTPEVLDAFKISLP